LDKSKVELDAKASEYNLGKARCVRDGEALTLIAVGGILQEAIEAASQLAVDGIRCRVLSMHTVKPLDYEAIDRAVSETAGIITIEENTVLGGLGSAVAEYCIEKDQRPGFFKRIGLEDTYPSVVGDQHYLRQHYKMDNKSIVETVRTSVDSEE